MMRRPTGRTALSICTLYDDLPVPYSCFVDSEEGLALGVPGLLLSGIHKDMITNDIYFEYVEKNVFLSHMQKKSD